MSRRAERCVLSCCPTVFEGWSAVIRLCYCLGCLLLTVLNPADGAVSLGPRSRCI